MRTSILTSKRAKALRRAMTEPEVMLWSRLRRELDHQPRWRRQHPIGVYIADFYCAAAKLVAEIDGAAHGEEEQLLHDQRRDRWMATQGLAVRRIAASSVFVDVDVVADGLRLTALARMRGTA